VNVDITEYTVSAFQSNAANAHRWRIQVRRSTDGLWIIHHNSRWLQPDRTWHPDHHSALIFADPENAISAAKTALRDLDVNGTTWDDMLRRGVTP
jgi:hypothetical protein